jgi:hypothetical protein
VRFVRGGTQAVWNPRGAGATEGTAHVAGGAEHAAARAADAAVGAERIA